MDETAKPQGVDSAIEVFRFVHHVDVPMRSFDFSLGQVLVFSGRSPRKTTVNEDAAIVISFADGRLVLAVADGVGGLKSGDVAASIAIEALIDRLSISTSVDSLRSDIVDAIEKANRAVLDSKIGCATTIVIVEIGFDYFRIYHVGDSMVLHTSNRGRIKHLTVPHSPVGMALEAGLIQEQDAIHHEFRHLVSNVIGSESMRIEIGPPSQMTARDTLVLASDGLFDNLLPAEITEVVRKGDMQSMQQKLIDAVKQRMTSPATGEPSKPDDLTIICFRPKAVMKATAINKKITERLEGNFS